MSGRRIARIGPLAALALLIALAPAPGHADPLPSGSMGLLFGAGAGTGASAHQLGLGYYEFGAQAAWQPMNTAQRVGWSLKWAFLFGTMYEAEAARIAPNLLTLQFDFMAGLRVRPGANPRRFLALRGGVELFRTNEPVAPSNTRAFAGPVAAAAFEQYLFGALLFNVDVRYGLIGSGPSEIALLAGVQLSVP